MKISLSACKCALGLAVMLAGAVFGTAAPEARAAQVYVLGNNDPVPLPEGVTATAVSAGFAHSLAVGSDGHVYAWGRGSEGQLGNGATASENPTPVAVTLPEGVRATAVGAGYYHSLAVGSDGNVYAWGLGVSGQLGSGSASSRLVPVAVSLAGGVRAIAVSGGNQHSLALGSDGNVYAWGSNARGQLGSGGTTQSLAPAAVSLASGVTATAVSAGFSHSLSLGSDGNIYSWGFNFSGQLGNNSTVQSPMPVAVSLAGGVRATVISAGYFHSLAIGGDGNLYTWGANSSGQLGNNTTTNGLVPVGVPLANGVKVAAISGGGSHSLAIGSDTKVYSWGDNGAGQLGIPTINQSLVPVNAGVAASAVTAGGSQSLVLSDAAPTILPPSISSVSLSSKAPKTRDKLKANVAASDPEGKPLTFSYLWKKTAGSATTTLSETGNTLDLALVGNGDKGDIISVTVVASNGTLSSEPVSASTTVQNTAPTITRVTLNTGAPKTNQVLKATVTATDADNDALTYSYVWTRDDVVIPGATTDTLDLSKPGQGDVGQKLRVTVVANDGSLLSKKVSANAQVVNSYPSISLSLAPNPAFTKTRLTATVITRDDDITRPTITFEWSVLRLGQISLKQKNMSKATTAAYDLNQPGYGDKGDTVLLRVTVRDIDIDFVKTASIKIQNSVPVMQKLTISPLSPTTNTLLKAGATAMDDDRDALTYFYTWSRNGTVIARQNGPTLDLSKPGFGDAGDTISVLARAGDGSALSATWQAQVKVAAGGELESQSDSSETTDPSAENL